MSEIRKIQKTGNMHYIYLPTSWCKQNKISTKSNVSLEQGEKGELTIYPQIITKTEKDIQLNIRTSDLEVIDKILMACYINPSKSFRLDFDQNIDLSKLLAHKRSFNIEFVEIDKNTIFCDSNISVSNPASLLNTVVRRIKALIYLMINNYDTAAIEKYEEEIDKAKILIDKAIISTLTAHSMLKVKTIDLYYMTAIIHELEKMVDSLTLINKSEKEFFREISSVIEFLQQMIDSLVNKNELSCRDAIEFIEKALAIKESAAQSVDSCYKARTRKTIIRVSEILVDWAVTKKVEQKS